MPKSRAANLYYVCVLQCLSSVPRLYTTCLVSGCVWPCVIAGICCQEWVCKKARGLNFPLLLTASPPSLNVPQHSRFLLKTHRSTHWDKQEYQTVGVSILEVKNLTNVSSHLYQFLPFCLFYFYFFLQNYTEVLQYWVKSVRINCPNKW